MGSINLSRVLIGGLVAGVVLNVIYFLGQFIGAEQMARGLERFGVTELSMHQNVVFACLNFFGAIALVWLYASIRPRFGAGIKTAIIAAVIAWFFESFIAAVLFITYGFFPPVGMAVSSIMELIMIIVTAIVGAWLYQESEPASD